MKGGSSAHAPVCKFTGCSQKVPRSNAAQIVDKVPVFGRGFCFCVRMLNDNLSNQVEMEFISIEELVPQDHLLRKIARTIDFGFIREKTRGLYCVDNGRPAVDPVVLFKMLFIGYLFGIRSERQLMREIEVNVAYRWFLGMGLRSAVPHHSTISQNRRRRFADGAVHQEIFDEIVLQALRHRLADGRVLYSDSTHLKASANKNKFELKEVRKSTRGYLEELDRDVARDREAQDKKPLPEKPGDEPGTTLTKVSTTDPESGFMVREGKPRGFFYLDHRTVDGRHGIVTDAFITAGNVHDSMPYLERLDRQRERFGFAVEAVGLDAGYYNAALCKGLSDRLIEGVIAYCRPTHREGMLRKNQFRYDAQTNSYTCPQGQQLACRTTTREGYREYASDPKTCARCPLLAQCTTSRNKTKVVTRHLWEDHREKVNGNRLTVWGKSIYKRRKETVERSFADAKELHGYRYARLRGRMKVQEQALLTAACQNMKKIAMELCKHIVKRPPPTGPQGPGSSPATTLIALISALMTARLSFLQKTA